MNEQLLEGSRVDPARAGLEEARFLCAPERTMDCRVREAQLVSEPGDRPWVLSPGELEKDDDVLRLQHSGSVPQHSIF